MKSLTGKAGIGLLSSVEQSSVVFVAVFGNGSGWKRSVVSCVVFVKEERRDGGFEDSLRREQKEPCHV